MRLSALLGAMLGALAAASCGGDESTLAGIPDADVGGSGPGTCGAGEILGGDGRCVPAGLPPEAPACPPGQAAATGGSCCAAGTLPSDQGLCLEAGIPPSECAAGFEPDDQQGCRPILPAEPCPDGLMAIMGETVCRPVVSCGDGAWGEIPVDSSTEFVDASYAGGGSDGTQAHPWTTIGEGIDAAANGAIVAVSAGSYAESLYLQDKALRLWGRCPEMVEIVATGDVAALVVGAGADGTEVHDLALRNGAPGIFVLGALDVVLDRVWVHGGDFGIIARGTDTDASVTVGRALIEDLTTIGVSIESADGLVDSSVVREIVPDAQQLGGNGVAVRYVLPSEHAPTARVVSSVLTHNGRVGVNAIGATVEVLDSVVQDTQPVQEEMGMAVAATPDGPSGERSSVTVRGSVLRANHAAGVLVRASDVWIEHTMVQGTLPEVVTGLFGCGVQVEASESSGATATIRSSVLAANHGAGLAVQGSGADVEATIIRDTEPSPAEVTTGMGLEALYDRANGLKAEVAVRGCVLERNHILGALVQGSKVSLSSTIVRETQPAAAAPVFGWGLEAIDDPDGVGPAELELRGSVVEDNVELGIGVRSSSLTMDTTIVRNTKPSPVDLSAGWGVQLTDDRSDDSIPRPRATITQSLITENQDVGLFVEGFDVLLKGLEVTGTLPRASDQTFGRAIHVQARLPWARPATAKVRQCLIHDNPDFGLMVLDSSVTVEGTLVSQILPQPSGLFGDGLAVGTIALPAVLTVTGSRVEGSARAGVSAFSGTLRLGTSVLDCNLMAMDGENLFGTPFELEDLGGNRCGCGEVVEACQVRSSGLEPPEPPAEPPFGL